MSRKKRTDNSLIPIKLKLLNYSNYKSYLESKHWQDLRKRFYKSKLVKKIDNKIVCYSCQETKPLSLHHKTYKRMGKEKLNDLVLLCQNCHYLAHKIYDENKKLKNTEFYQSRLNLSNSYKKKLDN
jgi:hypothetical protein